MRVQAGEAEPQEQSDSHKRITPYPAPASQIRTVCDNSRTTEMDVSLASISYCTQLKETDEIRYCNFGYILWIVRRRERHLQLIKFLQSPKQVYQET